MTDKDSHAARTEIVEVARALYQRGLTSGTSGNVSMRVDGGVIVTPTNASLGDLRPEQLAFVSESGEHVAGLTPSKEAFLHQAIFRARPNDRGVVHLHSTHATALSCIEGPNGEDALPPLTAYFAMRVGRLLRLPYAAPGDEGIVGAVETAAAAGAALLLSNHGPIVSAPTLREAAHAAEEIEETARIFFLLRDVTVRPLSPEQVAALRPRQQ